MVHRGSTCGTESNKSDASAGGHKDNARLESHQWPSSYKVTRVQ